MGNSRSAESFTGHTLSFNNSYVFGENFIEWVNEFLSWGAKHNYIIKFRFELDSNIDFFNFIYKGQQKQN